MKRVLYIFILVVACKINLPAQAFEGKIEYQKTMQPVAVIEWQYSERIVEDAIKDYLGKRGSKETSSNGFHVFKAAKLDSSDTDPSDLYFKIERKSRKEKDITVVSLLATKTNEAIPVPSTDGSSRIEAEKSFLNNIAPSIEAHDLEVSINDQENAVKKARKKYDNLLNEQNDLDKRIRKLQGELDQNKTEQQKEANLIQDNSEQDIGTKEKLHKKMGHLLNEQGDLQKKLRKSQGDLDQNGKDQVKQNEELQQQQKLLEDLKTKQKAAGSL
jgi:hypothetical protein